PCYVRGIVEGNGNPPGEDLWLTYSMNKEDMWVSRVPLPVRYRWDGKVEDSFDSLETEGTVANWNLYDPLWAPVGVAGDTDGPNKYLRLEDKDPYDYARAVRVFEEGNRVDIGLKVLAEQSDHGMLDLEVCDSYGGRPVQIRFDSDGKIKTMNGAEWTVLRGYEADTWVDLTIALDATPHGDYSVTIDGENLLEKSELAMAVKSVERLSIRTGPYRDLPNRKTDNQDPGPPLPEADEPVPSAVFLVDDVIIKNR
ncbi:MAG: hypothetical protein KC931_26735, partial [Candidatus Omnitrophica bacterium]|nr:hypothetical protein [Candidatus Omnitrophota bacterium]